MLRHLVTSAVFIVPSLLLVVVVCWRWQVGKQFTIRNFVLGAVGVMIGVAVLSETAIVRERRCRRDPSEFCEYNDNVPAISVLVFLFFIIAIGRSMMLYGER